MDWAFGSQLNAIWGGDSCTTALTSTTVSRGVCARAIPLVNRARSIPAILALENIREKLATTFGQSRTRRSARERFTNVARGDTLRSTHESAHRSHHFRPALAQRLRGRCRDARRATHRAARLQGRTAEIRDGARRLVGLDGDR